jgi:hypothetical protein
MLFLTRSNTFSHGLSSKNWDQMKTPFGTRKKLTIIEYSLFYFNHNNIQVIAVTYTYTLNLICLR